MEDRFPAILDRLGEPVFVESEPGDVLFFHRDFSQTVKVIIMPKIFLFSNLLHTSGPNTSLDPRWNLVLAYNQVWF